MEIEGEGRTEDWNGIEKREKCRSKVETHDRNRRERERRNGRIEETKERDKGRRRSQDERV